MARLAALLCLTLAAFLAPPAKACDVDRPVVFGGLDWESAAFGTEVARFILEKGYDCRTKVFSGSTIPILTGLGRGDIDVVMEVWLDNVTKPWEEALARGEVMQVGVNFPDANQGWFVPRYVVEGDAKRGIEPMAPDLKRADQLADYKALFKDPEDPEKGRFYNCVLGWQCEINNTNKLIGYGLEDDYTNIRPGAGAALSAAIASAYNQGKPIFAYYWGPTWVLGSFDLYQLEERPYEKAEWTAFNKDPANNLPTAYPTVEVIIGANTAFAKDAPNIIGFLKSYRTTNKLISDVLAEMEAKKISAEDAGIAFLKNRPDIWKAWLAPGIAAKVEAALPGTGDAPPPQAAPKFPESIHLPLGKWTDAAFDWLIANYGSSFEAVTTAVLFVLVPLEQTLRSAPWWAVAIVVAGLAYAASRSWQLPLATVALLVFIGSLGLWDLAMQTLGLMLLSMAIAVAIGVPVGILMSESRLSRRIILPALDAMQTLPSFVYLIPAIMLFRLGKVPALFATIIYATPPLIRLTDLGLRTVNAALVEVAADLGADRRRQLFDVRLPLAKPTILAGINQTTMMALSMVVIASIVGAGGLGQEVLLGIQRLDIGRGLSAGLAIVALAIIFDRVTQAYGGVDLKTVKPPGT